MSCFVAAGAWTPAAPSLKGGPKIAADVPFFGWSPGPWAPQQTGKKLGPGHYLQSGGPTTADTKCQAFLQRALRVKDQGAIRLWMESSSPEARQEMADLGQMLQGSAVPKARPQRSTRPSSQPAPPRRTGSEPAIQAVSADRMQVDMLRRGANGAERRDLEKMRARNARGDTVPDECLRPYSAPLQMRELSTSLNPEASRLLAAKAAELDGVSVAKVRRAMRSLDQVVSTLPARRGEPPAGPRATQRRLHQSASAPGLSRSFGDSRSDAEGCVPESHRRGTLKLSAGKGGTQEWSSTYTLTYDERLKPT